MAEASTGRQRRDYSMFDAELSGAVLNLSLLRRLLHSRLELRSGTASSIPQP